MNFTYRCKHQKVDGGSVKESILPITIFGENGVITNFNAILDSGSDFTLIPLEVAQALELKFDSKKQLNAKQYSGAKFTTTETSVFMKIRKGRQESIKFKVKCMINLNKDLQLEDIILGSSFFEHFRILFDYPNNKFQIKSKK